MSADYTLNGFLNVNYLLPLLTVKYEDHKQRNIAPNFFAINKGGVTLVRVNKRTSKIMTIRKYNGHDETWLIKLLAEQFGISVTPVKQ